MHRCKEYGGESKSGGPPPHAAAAPPPPLMLMILNPRKRNIWFSWILLMSLKILDTNVNEERAKLEVAENLLQILMK